jgi:hypothetical protein
MKLVHGFAANAQRPLDSRSGQRIGLVTVQRSSRVYALTRRRFTTKYVTPRDLVEVTLRCADTGALQPVADSLNGGRCNFIVAQTRTQGGPIVCVWAGELLRCSTCVVGFGRRICDSDCHADIEGWLRGIGRLRQTLYNSSPSGR